MSLHHFKVGAIVSFDTGAKALPLQPATYVVEAQMPPVGDNWKGLGPDHLHPDETGYQLWADALRPLVTSLMATTATPPADRQR